MIVCFQRTSYLTYYEKIVSRYDQIAGSYSLARKPQGRDHCPTLSITDDMPEAGGGGESAAAPEVASDDDDDGGDSDGEPARRKATRTRIQLDGADKRNVSTNKRRDGAVNHMTTPSSASKEHHGLTRSRTRHQADTPPEIKTIGVEEHAMAASIGMSVEFLRKDRSGKRLIPFYRIGTAIRYNPTRVSEALTALEQGGYAPKPKASKARQSNLTAG